MWVGMHSGWHGEQIKDTSLGRYTYLVYIYLVLTYAMNSDLYIVLRHQ